ncbi:hypothetical protein KKI43_02630 [Arthrobacter sp. GN70]|uniref:Lipoprotein n=1 Tax=Arthrobacter terricola TaxID=2547396 RepID=A0A4R5K8U2_9MICC|nr:hypothetical protein [Arthrobacter sp. GN70]TDF91379.1 hypothetical protein E1809_20850 [Arthrobacter terricola]
MKLFGKPQPATLALVAVGAALSLSACGGMPTSSAPSEVPAPASSAPASSASSSPQATSSSSATAGASASVGSLVPGFPQQLVPLMPQAAVESSSFDKNSSPASVALVGTIAAPADAVVAFYTSAFTAQGFKEVPGSTVGTIRSKDFLRGDNETVNISVVENAGKSTFTIGANVAPGSIK